MSIHLSNVEIEPTVELPQITDNDLKILDITLVESQVNLNQFGNAQESVPLLLVTFVQEKGVQTDP